MMRAFLMRALTAVCVAMAASSAMAAPGPDEVIKSVGDEVLAIVRSDKAIQSGDLQKSLALIEEKVLPHFDFSRMTALAVGRDWRSASADQKTALTNEFRTLLVRSYANALNRFKDYQISFKPLKMKDGETDTVVRTEVRKAGAQPDSVDYSVYLKNGEWKVYDVAVAGVSLITSYRDSFGQEIKTSGIDGLIASLKTKNSQNSSGGAK
ncbi:ABC transporter substrate-binding protein [Niveibacterium sp. SC-1]|uniref:MlaC/ttg2D family ABC transporter substrate-binding protein n=1 Tax=Niveibacterium sp. SC-1 TaxID=3135646 RepID=UPI0031201232